MQNSVVPLNPAIFLAGRLVTGELFVEFQLPKFLVLSGRASSSFQERHFFCEKSGISKIDYFQQPSWYYGDFFMKLIHFRVESRKKIFG